MERAFRNAAPDEVSSHRQKKRDLIHAGEHLVQACKHVSTWSRGQRLYHQWIAFDDVWASAFPDPANSLLRFAARWDML